MMVPSRPWARGPGPRGPDELSPIGGRVRKAAPQRSTGKTRVVQSQGKTGSAFDKAMAESFFLHLKTEGIYPHPLESESITRIRVADYIESFYNSKRLHSGL
jgi:transposase InsO family protein